MLSNGKDIHSNYKPANLPQSDASNTIESESVEKFNWLIHLQHTRHQKTFCKDLIAAESHRSGDKNEYVLFKKGIIQKEEGNIQEALETFQKCLKLNEKNTTIIKEIAGCLYDMQRYRLALNVYLEAEQLAKNVDWQLCHLIAETYLKLGNLERAKEYAHKSVKVGKQEESYTLLMKILMAERDFTSAMAVANAAVESCPDSAQLLIDSGILYLKAGQTQHSFERFSQALALNPTSWKALLGIGCITHKHEEFDVALSKYKIAVLYQPESVALWNNIGLCFYSKQKYIAAISCLKRGLWISPLNWKLLYNLALVHLSTNQAASGFNFACAAVNLRPNVGECFGLLGCTLYELKDTENAFKALRQAYSLAPTDMTVVANAALLAEMTGAVQDSQQFIDEFKKLREENRSRDDEAEKLVEALIQIQEAKNAQVEATNSEETETGEGKREYAHDDEV
ncbi:Bardet-Biedl syndrome 4 protein homolog [Anthonomus grandis grandis]|uniref:Bardet-Biedl syndrome 4 protein homolog n=1 Tax=Anthonomus grandis grandis TaxID=2921223 RepID=UPI0021650F02|nr:Bardet-Biedl syndrome 4 protein homolog [Anthonomus grandis grandis]